MFVFALFFRCKRSGTVYGSSVPRDDRPLRGSVRYYGRVLQESHSVGTGTAEDSAPRGPRESRHRVSFQRVARAFGRFRRIDGAERFASGTGTVLPRTAAAPTAIRLLRVGVRSGLVGLVGRPLYRLPFRQRRVGAPGVVSSPRLPTPDRSAQCLLVACGLLGDLSFLLAHGPGERGCG